jgi:hypothetical protein
MKTIIQLLIVFVFISTFIQAQDNIQKVVASDREEDDKFGDVVAISGNYAIIGAKYESTVGTVYIFEKGASGDFEEMAKLSASIPLAGGWFGWSVAIDGNYAIVGAMGESYDVNGNDVKSEAGAVYIFQRDGSGNWNEVQKIVASDRDYVAHFGWSVAIQNDQIIVGARDEDYDVSGGNFIDNAGAAYIFKNEDGFWTEKQKIVSSDRQALDWFGHAVSIDGNFAIIGDPWEDEDENGENTLDRAGSVYVFQSDGGDSWFQSQKIVAPDRENIWDQFGFSVDISGEYLAIGADFRDKYVNGIDDMFDAGSVYMYELSGSGSWAFSEQLYASDANIGEQFGNNVGLNEGHLIVGAFAENDFINGNGELFRAGAAYYFKKSNSGTWDEIQKITAPVRAEYDEFGFGVDIANDGTSLIGAWAEDEDENEENTLDYAGSAYFWKSGINGIANIEFPGTVSIYPNPVSSFINIRMDDNYNMEIRLVDILGKTVIETSSIGKTNNIMVDMSGLNKGIYFIEIMSNDFYSTSKIIKK